MTGVATTTIVLAGAGPVDVCAMILPVYWDLAAILVAKEIDAFRPNLVLMNGVAVVAAAAKVKPPKASRATRARPKAKALPKPS